MRTIQKSYKFRLYPNQTQKQKLANTFGCVRFYWNKLVEIFTSNTENAIKQVYQSTTEYRKEYPWMKEVSAAVLQQKERDFLVYKDQRFNSSRKTKLGQPHFKKKIDKQSFRLPNQKFELRGTRVWLEKIGKVLFTQDRPIPENAKFINCTVSKNKADQYFISVCVEQTVEPKPKTDKQVGIDVGLKSFAVTSDNVVVNNPRYLRENQAKLSRLQRIQSRKQGNKKGETKSSRWLKLRQRINRLFNKISNQRNWFLHSLTTSLVSNYDLIAVEDLNIQGMQKNHKLARAIGDVSWGEFFRQLEYKCAWYAKKLVTIGRLEPTSKTCSNCGYHYNDLTLADRALACPECQMVIDRDYNAALNILSLGVNSDINRTLRLKVT